jgi:hypothetical protein
MTNQQQKKHQAVVAIEYAITADEPQAFLKCWLEGDWTAIRKEWPDAPEECYEQPPVPIKLYYMRDNHTFVPLPLDTEAAEVILKNELKCGYTHGMLCSHAMPGDYVHAHGLDREEDFLEKAREWIQTAIHKNTAIVSKVTL